MNDPLLPAQWHYDNTGYQVLVTQAGADVNLFDAWKKNQGSSDIVVAVIDQAVQYTHPDLQANIWVNPNPEDDDLHGYNFVNNTAELDWSYADREEYQGQIYYPTPTTERMWPARSRRSTTTIGAFAASPGAVTAQAA